jgi:hypothetical protein
MTTVLDGILGSGPARRLRALVRGTSRSTTRRKLWALLTVLLVATITVFATSLVVFTRVHDTARSVHTRTAPAILGLANARAALVRADSAAIGSFRTGEARLAGPGEAFQNQITIASQSLTRVAENNMAGEVGSSRLQLVDGLLATYTRQVGQADAQFRQPGAETLGVADLWGASRLLHREQTGLLAQLDSLLDAQKAALDGQLSASSMGPGTILALLVPLFGLLALLVVAQVVLYRRFRRMVNLWLVAATLLLLAMAALSTRDFVAPAHLEQARSTLYQLVDDGDAQSAQTDAQGQRALRDLVVGTGCGGAAACGDTVARFVVDTAKLGGTERSVGDSRLTDETRRVSEQTTAAGAGSGLQPWIYFLAIGIAACSFAGFLGRLNEYRYRPR